ncbi:helix-turn-helix domain-containing protein [Laribacter hongkongensis]|uniref:helix-turn-helix domain-containing protein n=1 Tax=Laribacter hongkongensis TaxID=168471 RepID=UPI001EFC6513|nr:helix-turn-helix domain-containing protein [Laribacter hongkongensis]MCG9086851.1 helix-turn-helix domain-containing protein [Laribacter hongkongensis]
MSTSNAPKKAALEDWHRADIVAAVHKAGWSMRRLSLDAGLSEWALKNALDRPWPRGERIIASALGMEPEAIWPRRYAMRNFKPVFPSIPKRNPNCPAVMG